MHDWAVARKIQPLTSLPLSRWFRHGTPTGLWRGRSSHLPRCRSRVGLGMAPRHTLEDVKHEAAKAGAAAARAAIKSIELPTRVGAIREAVETVMEEIRREAHRLASLPAYGPDLAAAWRTAALEACRAELILLNAVAEKVGHTEH